VTQQDPADVIGAVVLAAGLSTRLSQNKLLLPLGGKPVLHWVLDALLTAGFQPITVVLGHQGEEIRRNCGSYGDSLSFVENQSYSSGRATSVQAGLDALPGLMQGVLITPGDVPFIGGNLVAKLVDQFFVTRRITFPLVGSRKGHPVIFPSSSFPLLRGLRGDETLHDYFMQNPERTTVLDWQDEGCTLDIDTSQDLRRVLEYCAGLDKGLTAQ